MKVWFVLLVALVAGLLIPKLSAQSASADSSPELSKFFAAYFEERLRDEPEFATTVGRHEYDDRWSDVSRQGRDERRAHLAQRLDQLGKFPLDQLSEQDRLSVKLLRYDLGTQLDSLDIDTYLLRVGQMYGFHNRIYLTIDRMPVYTVRDCENIIARIRSVPALVDQNIAIMNEAIARGWTQPKIVADLVIEQLTAQVGQDASKSPLLAFIQKMPANIPEADRERLRKQGTDAFENDFRPAWRKLLAYMQTVYLPRVRPGIGIGSLPGGAEA